MGYRFESSITIAAPAQAIWDLIQSPSRRIEWDLRVVGVEFVTPGSLRKGSRVRSHYNFFGNKMWIEMEYLSFNIPRQSAIKATAFSKGNLFKKLAASWNLQTNSDGTTTWTTRLTLDAVGGKYIGAFLEATAGRYLSRLTRLSQQNLKRLVESEYLTRQNQKEEMVTA